MTVYAVRLLSVLGCSTDTAQDVRPNFHNLEMAWTDAPAVPAQMIGVHHLTARQRDTMGKLVGQPMGRRDPTVGALQLAVSVLPNMAAVLPAVTARIDLKE